jgi:hypothetical protein
LVTGDCPSGVGGSSTATGGTSSAMFRRKQNLAFVCR